jgi:hypothetical protein
MRSRPIGVTILAILAAVAAVVAAVNALQYWYHPILYWLRCHPHVQPLLCPDVGVDGLGIRLAFSDALAGRACGMDLPGCRHPFRNHAQLPGDARFQHLAGCKRVLFPQWHHPDLLYAAGREDSLWHGCRVLIESSPVAEAAPRPYSSGRRGS